MDVNPPKLVKIFEDDRLVRNLMDCLTFKDQWCVCVSITMEARFRKKND